MPASSSPACPALTQPFCCGAPSAASGAGSCAATRVTAGFGAEAAFAARSRWSCAPHETTVGGPQRSRPGEPGSQHTGGRGHTRGCAPGGRQRTNATTLAPQDSASGGAPQRSSPRSAPRARITNAAPPPVPPSEPPPPPHLLCGPKGLAKDAARNSHDLAPPTGQKIFRSWMHRRTAASCPHRVCRGRPAACAARSPASYLPGITASLAGRPPQLSQ